MKKSKFIVELLEPLCKAADEDIRFLIPLYNMAGDDVKGVAIGYKNHNIVNVNVECDSDSLLAIAKDVLNKI